MSITLRFVLAFLLIAVICSSVVLASLEDSHVGSPEYLYKRSFQNWQKKWARLEPSIRFFKRSGFQPLYDGEFF